MIPLIALLVCGWLLPQRTAASSDAKSVPYWTEVRIHLDWKTARHEVRWQWSAHAMPRYTGYPINGHWSRRSRLSPHVVLEVWYPIFGQPARRDNPWHYAPVVWSALAEASERTGVSLQLLGAITQRESSGNPNAVSRSGAVGLMQVLPSTARGICGIGDARALFDPYVGALCGAEVIRSYLIAAHGNVSAALWGYSGGGYASV